MSAHAFNPLKAARAFREAGADENLAEAMAGAIGDAAEKVEENLVTKADLHAFEQRLTGGMEALEQRTTSAMEALEQRMRATLFRALWLQTGAIIAAVTAVTKLLP